MWANAYLCEKFCAGIRTTSRCEDINSSLKKFIKSENCLLEFVENLDQVVKDYQNNEFIADYKTLYSNPVLTTALETLERSVSKFYTRKIFYEVQKQIEGVGALLVLHRDSIGSTEKFMFRKYQKPHHVYSVFVDRSCDKYECSSAQCTESYNTAMTEKNCNIWGRCWEKIIEHAKSCEIDNNERYIYQYFKRTAEQPIPISLLLNCIYEPVAISYDGQNFCSLESLDVDGKGCVETIKQDAYKNLNDLKPFEASSECGVVGEGQGHMVQPWAIGRGEQVGCSSQQLLYEAKWEGYMSPLQLDQLLNNPLNSAGEDKIPHHHSSTPKVRNMQNNNDDNN
ncbi:hypothetical protein Ahy_A06g027328 [Arachis hypogaea]|uniref:Protein FAR1-RELATED SEQUENCE n=1 Tax=Arachis hypogaea TaxID=3818 RepID=A0A445CND1_ARAHY|nr:hypothetical protein Ahy_A06g027328 [Arachis hypogaea]